jgi:hypothetical protein
MMEVNMKKHLIPVIALLLAVILSSCVGSSPASEKKISMYDLSVAMRSACGSPEDMSYVSSEDESAETALSKIADFEYSEIDSFFILYASDGSKSADEIVVTAAKDPAYVQQMTALLRDHLTYRTSLYKTYAPEQIPKLEKAEVFSEGNYAVLIVADNTGRIHSAFDNFINK